jgi:hypothetical protein
MIGPTTFGYWVILNIPPLNSNVEEKLFTLGLEIK